MNQRNRADEEFSEQYPYLTNKERFLVGWPGYRTRLGKSGLAYADTQAELGHMQGRMIRWLLTGKFKTHNPAYLALMVFVGLLWSWPLIPIFAAIFQGEVGFFFVILVNLPYLAIGVLLLVSAANCIFGQDDGESITGD